MLQLSGRLGHLPTRTLINEMIGRSQDKVTSE